MQFSVSLPGVGATRVTAVLIRSDILVGLPCKGYESHLPRGQLPLSDLHRVHPLTFDLFHLPIDGVWNCDS